MWLHLRLRPRPRLQFAECSQPLPSYDAGVYDGGGYDGGGYDPYQPQPFPAQDAMHNQYDTGYDFRPDAVENRQVRFQEDEPQLPDPRLGGSMALSNLGYDN